MENLRKGINQSIGVENVETPIKKPAVIGFRPTRSDRAKLNKIRKINGIKKMTDAIRFALDKAVAVNDKANLRHKETCSKANN